MDRKPPEPHSVVGWILMVTSVAIPGALAVVTAINPYFGWVSPNGLGGFPRLLVGAVGAILCAAAFGFLRYRRWSWWVAVAWGAVSTVEVVRFLVVGPALISILTPQMFAVALLVYVWRRRADFGVAFGAPRP